MTDEEREAIVKLQTDVSWIREIMGNHLKHHWVVTLAVVTCALCTAGSVLVTLICRGQ